MGATRRKPRDPVQEWATAQGRPVLLFVVGSRIGERHILQVEEQTRAVHSPSLDILIASNGGDPHVAFRLVGLLRRRFDFLHAVVPSSALSAATLLAIACDTLAFSSAGHLGPLDMQETGWNDKGLKESMPVSLKPAAIEKALEVAIEVCTNSIHQFPLVDNSRDAYRRAAELGSRLASPLLSTATLKALGKSTRLLQLGEAYASDVFRMRSNPAGVDRAKEVAHRLVYGYADHAFVIDEEQCRGFGLPVRSPQAHEMKLLEELALLSQQSIRAGSDDIRVIEPEDREEAHPMDDVTDETGSGRAQSRTARNARPKSRTAKRRSA